MLCKNLKTLVVRLNTACMNHGKMYNVTVPKITRQLKTTEDANYEINKMLNYLKHPYYSHLVKK